MTTELSTKTYMLVLKGGINIPITKEQKEKVAQVLNSKDNWTLEIEDNLISKSAINAVVSADMVDVAEKKARGMWQCKEKGHWNDRGTPKCSGCYF